MLKWVDEDPDYNLMALYLSEVDQAGHYHGPHSKQLHKSLEAVDKAIGKLLHGLKERNQLDGLNIVVVSDHGMTEASDDRKIFIDQYVPDLKELVGWADFGPIGAIIPKHGKTRILAYKLHRAIRQHKLPIKMYTKHTMPSRYHYTDNSRIPAIVLEAKRGWSIETTDVDWHPMGLHGYGDSVRDMDGVFIGSGPQFRGNEPPKYPYFSNLDVYPLITRILGIQANANNGTMALSAKALKLPRDIF